jgi:hypothetical protein
VVCPSFDLKTERAHCVWLDLVLPFMFHLVFFLKPEIWGSNEGHKMNKMDGMKLGTDEVSLSFVRATPPS